MEAESITIRPLTVAGAAQVRQALFSRALLLPVELRPVNHAASTNAAILPMKRHGQFLNCRLAEKRGIQIFEAGDIRVMVLFFITTQGFLAP
jgi:hypothetical protein